MGVPESLLTSRCKRSKLITFHPLYLKRTGCASIILEEVSGEKQARGFRGRTESENSAFVTGIWLVVKYVHVTVKFCFGSTCLTQLDGHVGNTAATGEREKQ